VSKHLLPALILIILAVSPMLSPTAAAAGPEVVADQWIVLDGPTGTVIGSHDASSQRSMASLTKIMTAVVALEHGHLDMPVTITQGDKVPESSAGLFVGTTPTLRTLLHALLLPSGNDAAMAIARSVGGSAIFENDGAREQFVVWMNEKAAELGLESTEFTNPHGLDEEGHYSTPADLAVLTRYALTVPDFREIFGAEEYRGDAYTFVQSNQLPDRLGNVVGGKTGWTDGCGRCLVEVVLHDDREVIIVLMGSDLNWYNDAIVLSDFAAALPRPADSRDRAHEHFEQLWGRTDSLVAGGVVQRSWLWGEAVGTIEALPSDESSTGKRYSRLYQKGQMEINHPYSDISSGWYITPSRLAAELIEGEATIPVAGDLDGIGPTYEDIARQVWNPQASGDPITRRLSASGASTSSQQLAEFGITAGTPSDATGLAMASVFEEFLWQTGPVVISDKVVEGMLFDPPLLAVGHPITEPFWVRVPVIGHYTDVLVQCFERRCLTYTPSHSKEWQVEMSNIGLHVDLWQSGWTASDSADTAHPGDRPF
jgi:D-alanyl-D-alanine carboxypeptidase (penicillin-binding protein 5/6)